MGCFYLFVLLHFPLPVGKEWGAGKFPVDVIVTQGSSVREAPGSLQQVGPGLPPGHTCASGERVTDGTETWNRPAMAAGRWG